MLYLLIEAKPTKENIQVNKSTIHNSVEKIIKEIDISPQSKFYWTAAQRCPGLALFLSLNQ